LARHGKTDGAQAQHLLVVNDDQAGCELIARILESAGWPAERIYDHNTALATLRSAEPPVTGVVLDFASGFSSSLKLLDTLRHGESAFTQLPVIMLATSDNNKMYAYQSGADAFMVRPFHMNDLIEEITAMLARSAEERDAHRRAEFKAAQAS